MITAYVGLCDDKLFIMRDEYPRCQIVQQALQFLIMLAAQCWITNGLPLSQEIINFIVGEKGAVSMSPWFLLLKSGCRKLSGSPVSNPGHQIQIALAHSRCSDELVPRQFLTASFMPICSNQSCIMAIWRF